MDLLLQLLAGAHVNDMTPQKQTCLHLAAAKDHSAISSVLLENGIEFDQMDDAWNNGKLCNTHYQIIIIIIIMDFI